MTENNNQHPETVKTTERHKLDLNGIATIAAVILSIVAISISLLEVTTMRTQQKASVWPYIELKASYSADSYQILMENKGVGPALVNNVTLTVDGKPYDDMDNIVKDLVGEKDAFSYDVYSVSNPSNSVISTQEKQRLFSVPLKTNDQQAKNFNPGLRFAKESSERFNIEICYCSIYEDCWTTNMKTSGALEVESCN